MTDLEKAWAAGFFEGEGSIRISARPSSRSEPTFGPDLSRPLAGIVGVSLDNREPIEETHEG